MSEQLLQHLSEIERAAEDVLADKREIVDLDQRRQKTREAARAVDRQRGQHWRGDESSAWLAMGGANCFLRVPADKALKLLNKGERDREMCRDFFFACNPPSSGWRLRRVHKSSSC